MDSESDDEEILMYAAFEEGTVDRKTFEMPDLHWKVIGLDSDTPIVQLGSSTFKGEWQDSMGTKMLFVEDLQPEKVDPAVTTVPPVMLKYLCQTRKVLNLTRVFLKPKSPLSEEHKESPKK